jgi:SNF2 family DNA or RNA helicase
MAKGKVKLPLFVAPNNLVKNWVKEVNETVTDFKFNTIPITGRTLEKWGEKKMVEMIKNAPPNTIFHTDMAFIKDHYRKLQVRFLSFSADIYTNLEWMKQFDWDYILFDESHYLKNAKGASGGSLQSRLFAELTLRDSVKYIRLASGTIIHKDVDDIIGQTRLFDPLIFRTHKDFLTKYSEDEAPGVWAPDAAKRIREHLNRFCA